MADSAVVPEPTVSAVDDASPTTVDGDSNDAKSTTTTKESTPPASGAVDATTPATSSDTNANTIKVKVHFGRVRTFELDVVETESVGSIKQRIEAETQVPLLLQKLVYKSAQLKDNEATVASVKLVNNAKILMLGATAADIQQACKKPTEAEIRAADTSTAKKREPLCEMTQHKKVVDAGKPDDAMLGIKNAKETLPPTPLTGMRTGRNRPVRLTFKLELDEVWIGTQERTQKTPMGNISDVVHEPIASQPEYSILGLKLGNTDQSIVWFYWVPSQYVDAIKRTILN